MARPGPIPPTATTYPFSGTTRGGRSNDSSAPSRSPSLDGFVGGCAGDNLLRGSVSSLIVQDPSSWVITRPILLDNPRPINQPTQPTTQPTTRDTTQHTTQVVTIIDNKTTDLTNNSTNSRSTFGGPTQVAYRRTSIDNNAGREAETERLRDLGPSTSTIVNLNSSEIGHQVL